MPKKSSSGAVKSSVGVAPSNPSVVNTNDSHKGTSKTTVKNQIKAPDVKTGGSIPFYKGVQSV